MTNNENYLIKEDLKNLLASINNLKEILNNQDMKDKKNNLQKLDFLGNNISILLKEIDLQIECSNQDEIQIIKKEIDQLKLYSLNLDQENSKEHILLKNNLQKLENEVNTLDSNINYLSGKYEENNQEIKDSIEDLKKNTLQYEENNNTFKNNINIKLNTLDNENYNTKKELMELSSDFKNIDYRTKKLESIIKIVKDESNEIDQKIAENNKKIYDNNLKIDKYYNLSNEKIDELKEKIEYNRKQINRINDNYTIPNSKDFEIIRQDFHNLKKELIHYSQILNDTEDKVRRINKNEEILEDVVYKLSFLEEQNKKNQMAFNDKLYRIEKSLNHHCHQYYRRGSNLKQFVAYNNC